MAYFVLWNGPQSIIDIYSSMNKYKTMSVVNIKSNHGTVGKRCEYSHIKYWLQNKNNVYVGRMMRIRISAKDSDDGSKTFIIPESKYHNPYIVGKDGTKDEVLQKFRKYFIDSGLVDTAKVELVGKTLGCWCHPEPCHAQIIMDLITR